MATRSPGRRSPRSPVGSSSPVGRSPGRRRRGGRSDRPSRDNRPSRANRPSREAGRSCNWCFTINHYTEEDLCIFPLSSVEVQYATYGKEVGEEDGTPHLQGYLQFKTRRTFAYVKSLLPRAHIELQRAKSNKRAQEYCHKEDSVPFEQGELKLSGSDLQKERGSSAANKRKAYADIRRGVPIQDVIDAVPEELSFIHQAARYAPARTEPARVLYLHGRTGCGKTTSTIKVLLDLQLSWFKKMPGTHWFDGYTGQDVLVLEEFQSCFTLTTFLSLCDPYPPQLQVKGGTMPNRSKFIIICSNSNPLQQYERVQAERPQSFAAFLRRIDVEVDCTGQPYGGIEAHIRSFLVAGMLPSDGISVTSTSGT
jgi:hypothetical protein